MWSVNMNGEWYPASSEHEIVQWLREGRVHLQSLVYRPHWPMPVQLANVPELAALIGGDPPRPAPTTSNTGNIAAWGIAGFFVFLVFCGITVTGKTATVAVSALLAAYLVLLVFGRAKSGPKVVRHVAALLWRHPVLSLGLLAIIGFATVGGWVTYSNRVDQCWALAEETGALKTKTWPSKSDEALAEIDRVASKFEKGSHECENLGMNEEAGMLDVARAAVISSKSEVEQMIRDERAQLAQGAREVEQKRARERAQEEQAARQASVLSESCLELSTKFGTSSKLSDLQKDEAWPRYKGGRFEWDLLITDVRAGTFGGYTVQAKCSPRSPSLVLDIQISFESDAKSYVLGLDKGSVYSMKGTLTHTSTLFGLGAVGAAP